MAKVFTITEGLENMGALRTGGQGSVYKARRGGVITAVKILPTPIHSEDENDKNFKDFQNEVSKLKKVNQESNPNVVKILSSGITESGSLPFIEMEFIEGPDLEDLLKPPHDPVFTIHEIVKVAEQLSHALAHCHNVFVKHGDIKSNNVKFNIDTGNYMLLDFGLAIMSDEQRRTSLRNAGAIEFMAPEQNEGEMRLESDVYSFGIILYELLAGIVPFPLHNKSETSRNAVMISHMEKPVPDILELREKNIPANWEEDRRCFEMQVPAWLLKIIAKCLEKRPESRFRNGGELHEAIVENSRVFAGDYIYDSSDGAVLKRENKRLKALLLQYQQGADKPAEGFVVTNETKAPEYISPLSGKIKKHFPAWFNKSYFDRVKPVFTGLVIIGVLALFAGYSMLSSAETETIDSAALNAGKERLRDSIDNAGRLNAQRHQDSINATNSQSSTDEQEQLSGKQRDRQNKQTEKQWERKKKESEKLREEIKKEFEKIFKGRDN